MSALTINAGSEPSAYERREIRLVRLDKARPAVILTRQLAVGSLSTVTVLPVTSTIRGLATEVVLDEANGLDQVSVANTDNVMTIPRDDVLGHVGYLSFPQEKQLASALAFAFNLEIRL